MTTSFRIEQGNFEFEFVFSGDDSRVTLNGRVVYEGSLTPEDLVVFSADGLEYRIAEVAGNYQIRVLSGRMAVIDGIYTANGIEVDADEGQEAARVPATCGFLGAIGGATFMIAGNLITSANPGFGIWIPGGAIGGAIGSTVGGALGGAFGKLLFANRPMSQQSTQHARKSPKHDTNILLIGVVAAMLFVGVAFGAIVAINLKRTTSKNKTASKVINHPTIETEENWKAQLLEATVVIQDADGEPIGLGLGMKTRTLISSARNLRSRTPKQLIFHFGMPTESERKLGSVSVDECSGLAVSKYSADLSYEVSASEALEQGTKVWVATIGQDQELVLSRGAISRVDQDAYHRISRLDVKSDNPQSNISGAPIVDQQGKLIGLVAGVLSDSAGYQVIPISTWFEASRGRVIDARITARTKERQLYFELFKFDPLARIEQVKILVFAGASPPTIARDSSGQWQRGHAETMEYQQRGSTLHFSKGLPESAYFQLQIVHRDGTDHYTRPVPLSRHVLIGKLKGRENSWEFGYDNSVARREFDPITLQRLPESMTEFAMNPDAGDIASIDGITKSLYLFHADDFGQHGNLPAPRLLELEYVPDFLIFKAYKNRSYYVVGSDNKDRLFLIDAKTFQIAEEIVTEAIPRHIASSSNLDDPFVYYLFRKVHAVNVHNMRDTRESNINHSKYFYIQGDGWTHYPRIHQGPNNRFLASEEKLFAPNMKESIGSFEFSPIGFMRTKPFVFGIDPDSRASFLKVQAGSRQTYQSVNHRMIPINSFAHSLSPAKFMVDDSHDRLFVGLGSSLATIPLDALNLPDEPLLDVQVNSFELEVGNKSKLDLTASDQRVEVEFVNPPDGMTGSAGQYEWTPSAYDAGSHNCDVKLAFGDMEVQQSITINVHPRSVRAPLDIKGMLIGPNARYYFCWSGVWNPPDGIRRKLLRSETQDSQLCLISGESGEQTLIKDYPFSIHRAIATGEHITCLDRFNLNRIIVLDSKNLEIVNEFETEQACHDLRVSDKHLAIKHEDVWSMYDIESYEKVDETLPVDDSESLAAFYVDGQMRDGLLYPLSGDVPKLIVSPPWWFLQGYQRDTFRPIENLRRVFEKDADEKNEWRHLTGPVLIPQLSCKAAVFRRLIPDREARTITKAISYVVADENGNMDQIPIMETTFPVTENYRLRGSPLLQVEGATAYIGYKDLIYCVPVKTERLLRQQDAPNDSEFYFKAVQSTLLIDGPSAVLEHQLVGGTSPIKFEKLSRGSATLAEGTSSLTVDTVENLRQAYTPFKKLLRKRGLTEAEIRAKIDEYIAKATRWFQLVTAKPPKGVPMGLPIHIKATDAEGREAELKYQVLLDVPIEDVVKWALKINWY